MEVQHADRYKRLITLKISRKEFLQKTNNQVSAIEDMQQKMDIDNDALDQQMSRIY